MEIRDYQPFYLDSPGALAKEIIRLGVDLAVDDDTAALAHPLEIGHKQISNRFCAQPITGCDAGPAGTPGKLTLRRYRRYAQGGYGLIWFESTAVGPVGNPRQLCLHDGTLDAFSSMVEATRTDALARPVLVLQLTTVPAPPDTVLSDSDIELSRDAFIQAAVLAARAGFDGVDIQCCGGSLAGSLLGAFSRPGKYGGSFENRSRFLLETLAGVREKAPSLLLACRLSAYGAIRGGFGVSAHDYRKPDLSEATLLVQKLHRAGLALLNVTCASPNLRDPAAGRGLSARSDDANPDEHPLMTLDRQLRIARALREASPGLAVVGSGFSWLRHFLPQVAAGAIRSGAIDIAGMGRGALAYPHAPAEFTARGKFEANSCCMVCFACSLLQAESESVGCVIRDSAVYGPVYRGMRRFDPDQLFASARRCHMCEAAPCISANPTHTDIPAFIQAYLKGDEDKAAAIIRESDPLPELTSRLSPAWVMGDGACIETSLTGTPVAILDLQYAISWRARGRGIIGVRVPAELTGKRVAIVGGGPAGIAAAVRLIERGHRVELFDISDRLGGTPERVIPGSRLPEVRAELDAVLQPALDAKRLQIHLRAALGENLVIDELRTAHDAVLLATGVWQERSLGKVPGVVDALTFLESAKRGSTTIGNRVAILAGGDSAMDAARTAQNLGAREIYIIFGGPRSEMHWHLPEIWFATPGVHAMMNWQPLGFEVDQSDTVCGVRIRNAGLRLETVLPVDFVVEAMELQVAGSIHSALAGIKFSAAGTVEVGDNFRTNLDRVYAAGALVNGGASVAQCVGEGVLAAASIHHDLVTHSPTS